MLAQSRSIAFKGAVQHNPHPFEMAPQQRQIPPTHTISPNHTRSLCPQATTTCYIRGPSHRPHITVHVLLLSQLEPTWRCLVMHAPTAMCGIHPRNTY
jgi:hypothetical protein